MNKIITHEEFKRFLFDLAHSVSSLDYQPPESNLQNNLLKRKLIEASEIIGETKKMAEYFGWKNLNE